MTISPQNPVCPLADKGFLVTDAQTLPSLINAHPTLLVLLQSDPNKHPEVADSWVIIPELLKQFPATSYTAAFADSEQSELIAREYRILNIRRCFSFASTVLSAVWRDYIAGKNTLSGWPHC
ncbi:hydrogenase 1 operon protein HyaE2 [Salmonella enterica subsp. enterica]|nr:hydrogenase 1 operon protein HyaE2 [Salmonella enterica subsp. enterica]